MDPDEEGFERNVQPSPVPPPLPPTVSYFAASTQKAEWILVRSYGSAAAWHEANRLLSHHGIIAQMRTSQGEDVDLDLLVLKTEAEWARDLLSNGPESTGDRPTGGFPMYPAKTLNISSNHVRAIPVETTGLPDRESARFTLVIAVLWIVLVAIILLTCWLFFMP